MQPSLAHVPVLLIESLEGLALAPDGTYVDATFGAGGHSRAILERLGPQGRLFAFDVDPSVHARPDLPDDPRLHLILANFRTLAPALEALGVETLDGVLFDFGVSSMQLDDATRGFSFSSDAPLDMRMDTASGESAAEFLERAEEREIADAIFSFGEERAARRIARAIVARREQGRVPQTTADLARLVSGVTHRPGKRERTHPATRTFQALRIAVNDELGAIQAGLEGAVSLLRPGGRIVAISFHSLEDRIVKVKFREHPTLRAVTRKPIVAGDDEAHSNPRARSAKLRVAERLEVPA